MGDLEQRVEVLEAKVKDLEETLKNMGISEQAEGFIKQKERILKMVNLINSVSDEPSLDFTKEEEAIAHLGQTRRTIDDQIRAAVTDAGTFSDDLPCDPRYFNYEVESGIETDLFWDRKEEIAALSDFVGKGLRITAYNGFDTDRAIIPNEIDGQPVISIGTKAFMNTTVSEVVLPKSLKAVLGEAFCGCSRIKHIDLPNTIEYLGSYCFAQSGIEELTLPTGLTEVPSGCCHQCEQLERVTLGTRVTTIGYSAFQKCTKLREVLLPETLLDVKSRAFEGTSIKTMIFPSSVRKVSYEIFGDSHTHKYYDVVCVFLGKDTVLDIDGYSYQFTFVSLLYCLPGSKVQQIAREKSIPMKPLSAFRMEN